MSASAIRDRPKLRGLSLGLLPCLALLVATLAPLARSPEQDSFPFSTYPMFARPRSDVRVLVVQYIDAEQAPHPTAPRHLGTEEVLQAASLVRQAWRGGPGSTGRLLQTASRRLHAAGVEHTQLQLVELTYDPIAYFATEEPPPAKSRRVLARSPATGAES